MMIKIGHLVNPFKCNTDNPSYLYYAQPITLKSMKVSKNRSEKLNKNLKVKLYSINYEEDNKIVPKYFNKLPNLEKSTSDYYETTKKLPFLKEMFDKLIKNSDCDYFIYTNSDISLKPHFYEKIFQIIKNEKRLSFTINRRDNIPKFIGNKRLTEKDLKILNKFRGDKHSGHDCFVIHRSLMEKIDLGQLFIGYPPWGTILVNILNKLDKTFKIYKHLFVTYHLGKDKAWKDNNNLLYQKNIENGEIIINKYLIN